MSNEPGTLTTEPQLTVRQYEALKRIRDNGPGAWCVGGRAGGATARMFMTLARQGLCTVAPFTITNKGRLLLENLDE